MPVSVVLALASPLASELARRELNRHNKYFNVVACAQTSKEILEQISEHQPDVAVISTDLPGEPSGGLKALRELRACSSTTRPIVLMECSDPELVINVFSAGARGVVSRTDSIAVLCKCIRSVHAGQIWADSQELQWIVKALGDREPVQIVSAKGIPLLTRREEQIVNMVVEGLPNQEIAVKLQMSAHTVKNHLFRIYEKLGVSNRVELILYAMSSKEGSQGPSTKTQKIA